MSWASLELSLLSNLQRDGWAAAPLQTLERAAADLEAARSPLSNWMAQREALDSTWRGLANRFSEKHGLWFEVDDKAAQVIFKRKGTS